MNSVVVCSVRRCIEPVEINKILVEKCTTGCKECPVGTGFIVIAYLTARLVAQEHSILPISNPYGITARYVTTTV
jgi:hypothetical protein